jgi:hypothetical protein
VYPIATDPSVTVTIPAIGFSVTAERPVKLYVRVNGLDEGSYRLCQGSTFDAGCATFEVVR